MAPFASLFANLFDRGDSATAERRAIIREWNKQRARAMSPNDLAEIDAIFSRHL
jgi:hypothetical protein